MPSLASQIENLRVEARYRYETGKPERANELTASALALFATLPADDPERGALDAGFAGLMKLLGRDADCEAHIREAITLATPGSHELGARQMFYATFLYERGRLDEAERLASDARGTFPERGYCDRLLAEIRAAHAR
jgi:hypothetical protein